MKIQQQKQAPQPATAAAPEGEFGHRCESIFGFQTKTIILVLCLILGNSIISSPSGGGGGCCFAQSTYTLPTASCQDPCGINSPIDGWISFMCHNLGADSSLDPNTYVVGNADGSGGTLGYLYQWGRGNDGHQLRNSANTSTLSTTDVPGHANFIVSIDDWRSPKNTALWGDIKTPNDPCPAGYKVPTISLLSSLSLLTKTWTGNGYRFNTGTNNLYLPAAGRRDVIAGNLYYVGNVGYYWSSSEGSPTSYNLLYFGNGYMYSNSESRAYGLSVRCVAE